MTKLLNSFKRVFYIEQLKQIGIREINGMKVDQMTDRELKLALALARVKED